jgi:hypothetical protein
MKMKAVNHEPMIRLKEPSPFKAGRMSAQQRLEDFLREQVMLCFLTWVQ